MTTWSTKKQKREREPSAIIGSSPPSVKSTFAEMDLPGFIGQVLSQYQDLVVDHVEKDIKSKALAGVKEETRLLHAQAIERLHSMEMQVHKGIQTVLDGAREGIFEMVRQEMHTVFGDLETSVQRLFADMDAGVEVEIERSTGDKTEAIVEQLLLQELLQEGLDLDEGLDEVETGDGVVESEEEQGPGVVRLKLPPPLDLKPLVGFYRGLAKTAQVRILRALGTVEEGVSIYVRPREMDTLPEVLRGIPGVKVEPDESPDGRFDTADGVGADAELTLRVELTSTGQ